MFLESLFAFKRWPMLRIKTNTKMKDMLLSENVAIGIKGNKDYTVV